MGKIKQYFSMQRVLLLALLFVCLAPLSALAQTIQLTGTVTDTKGESPYRCQCPGKRNQ